MTSVKCITVGLGLMIRAEFPAATAASDAARTLARCHLERRHVLVMGFLSLVAVAYFWKNVPETEGLTLEEIERTMT